MARILATGCWRAAMRGARARSPAATTRPCWKSKKPAAPPLPPCPKGAISTKGRRSARRQASGHDGVDGLGQADIPGAQPAGVMGGQRHRDAIVAIGPVGMVTGLFCRQRHPAHKAECLGKILELEHMADGARRRVIDPAIELAQALLAFVLTQSVDHFSHPLPCN